MYEAAVITLTDAAEPRLPLANCHLGAYRGCWAVLDVPVGSRWWRERGKWGELGTFAGSSAWECFVVVEGFGASLIGP